MGKDDKLAKALDGLDEEDYEVFTTKKGKLAVKAPDSATYERFVDKVSNDSKSRASAIKELVYSCRLYPEREAFASILDRYPGLTLKLAGSIQELAGSELEADAKKSG